MHSLHSQREEVLPGLLGKGGPGPVAFLSLRLRLRRRPSVRLYGHGRCARQRPFCATATAGRRRHSAARSPSQITATVLSVGPEFFSGESMSPTTLYLLCPDWWHIRATWATWRHARAPKPVAATSNFTKPRCTGLSANLPSSHNSDFPLNDL